MTVQVSGLAIDRELAKIALPPAGAHEMAAPDGEMAAEIDLCTGVARALHGYGSSALRLEQRLGQLSESLGVPGQFFVTPTAVFASYRLPGKVRAHTQLLRLEPGEVDLGRASEVETLLETVRAGHLSAAAALPALVAIVERPTSVGTVVDVASAVAISASAVVLFGGRAPELAVAAVMGAVIGAGERLLADRPSARRLLPPAFAALVAFVTPAVALLWRDLSVPTAQLASLILLVPGLELTVGIKEVATANLLSGAARLVNALGSFLALGFGLALGGEVARQAFGEPLAAGALSALPLWAVLVAFGAAAAGFAGRFRAHRRDLVWVWVACALGFGGAALGTSLLGAPLGAFVGALGVGLAANAYARATGRSPLVMMVPGIILLVPGSVGVSSFSMLLRHDVIPAIEAAFTMALTASAITTGLLLANVLLPSDLSPTQEETR